jgi:hypothetical protein
MAVGHTCRIYSAAKIRCHESLCEQAKEQRWNSHEEVRFFIANAGANHEVAIQLYQILNGLGRVFLGSESLLPGDRWDEELPTVRKESRVTVVRISSRTEQAYYQREGIAAAVDLSRSWSCTDTPSVGP